MIFNSAKKRLSFILPSTILLTACATGPNQQVLQQGKEIFKAGDVRGALLSYEEAYKGQQNKDTTYFLDKGTIVKYMGPAALSESSLNLRRADAVVQNWEEKAKVNIGRNSADFLNYFFAPVSSGAPYEPKDFEKSMLGYQLAVNHILAGRWDFAAIEARKMAEREKLIEALRQKQVEAVRRKEMENASNRSAAFSRVENINGYPVDVINSPEINSLKNSYQNAAAHYLAGFIFESQGEASLAAPGYRLAVELKPTVPLFRNSLQRLDQSASRSESNLSDTLVIVETGSVPTIYSHKSSHFFPGRRGPRLVTFTIPAIEPSIDFFAPALVRVGETQVPLYVATNLDAMVRRQLKDEMPGYILKASTQAIVQVLAQEAAQAALERNRDQPGYALLAALAIGAVMSVGDADVRTWTSLPSGIHLGRAELPKGESKITVPTPAGYVTVPISLSQRYEVVHVRVLRNQAIVTTRPASGVLAGYMETPKPVQVATAPAQPAKAEPAPAAAMVPVSAPATLPETVPATAIAPAVPEKKQEVASLAQDAGNNGNTEKKSDMITDLNCKLSEGFSALTQFFNKTDPKEGGKDNANNCKK